MFWDMASNRKKLDQWESRLRQDVGEGDLTIGELGYTQQHLGEIGDLLYGTIFYRLQQGASIDVKLRQVFTEWPLTFVLYLVLEGVHHYGAAGLYWHGPKKRLKIGGNHTTPCGQLFLNILAQYNLPTFEQSSGLRYVTPILLHGGIPNRFLEEFFDFLYRYEVQPHRIVIDAQTLVATWRQQVDDLAGLPKPVSRFLRYGGLVAEDFVARCLDLFRVTTESEIDALGLPERVQSAYRTWQEQQTGEIHSRPLRSPIRLQRPVLTVAPYTEGVTLYLPPQQIPSRDAPREMSWRVTAGSHTQMIHTNRQRIENSYRYTATTELCSVPPTEEYLVELVADEEPLQEWVLPGLGTLPLMVFDPFDDYEADALDEQERHRSGERWLLYPDTFSLQASGESRRIRQLPQLTEAWRGYCLNVWQLTPGKLTLLDGNDQPAHHFSIIHERRRKQPYLDGGERPLPGLTHNDFPLYCGHPPALVIHTTQPQRWRVSVRADGNAQPAGYRSFPLSSLSFQRQEQDDSVHLDLADSRLLGCQPIGKFEITVRGLLGHNYTLGLRGVPPITIEGHDTLYLAPPDEPAHLRITCDVATTIRPNPPQAGVVLRELWLSENRREYILTVEAPIPQVTLQLRHEIGIAIPLSIPIQRLRWSLHAGLTTDNERKWQTQPLSLFPSGLGANAELHVILPLFAGGPELHIGWRLLDDDGQILREVPPDRKLLQRLVTFPMSEVLGLWREQQEPLRWQLEILVEGQDEPVTVDALYLLPELNLGEVLYEWQETAEKVQLTLFWANSQPRHKELRLWSRDRPWVDTPITLRMPDTDITLAEWQLPKSNLPAGAYLGEIATYNPWASQQPQRPDPAQPNTTLIESPGVAQHYSEIARLRDQGEADAEQLLALFVHQFYNGQQVEFHNTNKTLADQRESLSLAWLVRWAETTRKLDSTAYNLTRIRMFDQLVVDRLAQSDFPDDKLERYFQHLRVDKPLERLHLWVLQSGLRAAPRKRCLELLCSLSLDKAAFHTVMATLLEEVDDASLLLSEAVTLLKNNHQDAAEYLAVQGSQDAAELLRELTRQAHLAVSWIWPQITLDTSVGPIIIHSLRDRHTGQARYCAPLSGDCYADGSLQLSPFTVSVRLDLYNCLLHFNTHNPYQCQCCQQLFSDISGYVQHHESMHAGQSQARSRLKQNEKLEWIRPQLDDEREEERL